MRIFANAFLVAFAIDALLALSSAVLAGPESAWLGTLRAGSASLVMLVSLPLFVLLGLHPGLRWRIFLPPCLFLSWLALGAMPLPIWFSGAQASLISGTLEAGFAAIAFALCRRQNVRHSENDALTTREWLLSERALAGPVLSGRTALGFTALNLLVILPGSLVYLALSAAAGASYLTGHFLEIRGDGIHLSHREYTRGPQRIHLVAMMHIGEPAFYDELQESLPRQGAITLAEGVSDKTGLLSEGLSYGNTASFMGLVEQPALSGDDRELRYADVDVSEFSPETLALLSGVGRVLGAETFREALIAYVEFSNMSSERAMRAIAVLQHDLIERRNEHVVEEIVTSLDLFDVVVVPWGALHLPGIQDRVRDLGFVQDAATDRRVVSW